MYGAFELDVTPTTEGLFSGVIRELQSIAGGLQVTALVILGICLVVGVISWLVGRVTSSPNMQRVTGMIVITCIAGSVLVGAAFGLITWAANQGTSWIPA